MSKYSFQNSKRDPFSDEGEKTGINLLVSTLHVPGIQITDASRAHVRTKWKMKLRRKTGKVSLKLKEE